MTRVSGVLDPESAAVIRRVLFGISDELYRRDHPESEPVPYTETTSEQRLADAWTEMARRAEAHKGPAPNHDRVVVTMTLADLEGRLGGTPPPPTAPPCPPRSHGAWPATPGSSPWSSAADPSPPTWAAPSASPPPGNAC